MQMWLRQASLTIGQQQYTLDNLNFSFKVIYEDRAKVSTATLDVYNLSPSTRMALKKGDAIIISAGYKGDVGSIFVGAIADFSHTNDATDVVTKITAADSMDAWLGISVNKTYKAGMYAADIITDLLNIFGVEVGIFSLALNKYYPGCRVCQGKLKDILTAIVVSDCKSRLVIRCGQIVINPPTEGINSGYMLSPQTGLLKSSAKKEGQTVNNSTSATTKTQSDENEEDGTATYTCLLNYHIGVADVIGVSDSKTNGLFMVIAGTHEGSRTGTWQTTLEVKPA